MTTESPRSFSPPEQRERRRPSNALLVTSAVFVGGAVLNKYPEAAVKALPYATHGLYALALGCIVLPILSRRRR